VDYLAFVGFPIIGMCIAMFGVRVGRCWGALKKLKKLTYETLPADQHISDYYWASSELLRAFGFKSKN
jgi:hypothetical protein